MLQVKLAETTEDTDGRWVTHPSGARLLIARAGNSKYLKATDRYEAPFRRDIQRGKLASNDQVDILARSMAAAMLLDWEDVRDMDGNVIPYSKETAFKALRHDIAFRNFVMDAAIEDEAARQELIDEQAKK